MQRPLHVRKQQKLEHHYFELFRKAYGLPPVTYRDMPDVVTTAGTQTLGIEITNFYDFRMDHVQPVSRFNENAVKMHSWLPIASTPKAAPRRTFSCRSGSIISIPSTIFIALQHN